MRTGHEWDQKSRDTWWNAYYRWLEPILFVDRRWALMPDSPAAPTQINDGLLNDWPHGRERGVPVWHMDGSIARLARLCEQYPRVAIGWIGHPKREPVGCPAYRRKMDEVALLMGSTWHPLHMLRGIKVAFDYPFAGADSTSLAQNGWRYDSPWMKAYGAPWIGREWYADKLEQRLCETKSLRPVLTQSSSPGLVATPPIVLSTSGGLATRSSWEKATLSPSPLVNGWPISRAITAAVAHTL